MTAGTVLVAIVETVVCGASAYRAKCLGCSWTCCRQAHDRETTAVRHAHRHTEHDHPTTEENQMTQRHSAKARTAGTRNMACHGSARACEVIHPDTATCVCGARITYNDFAWTDAMNDDTCDGETAHRPAVEVQS